MALETSAFVVKQRRTTRFFPVDGEPDSRVPGVTAGPESGEEQESEQENRGFTRSHVYEQKEQLELYLLKVWACEKTFPTLRTTAVNSDRECSSGEMSKARPGETRLAVPAAAKGTRNQARRGENGISPDRARRALQDGVSSVSFRVSYSENG